ncbi:transposase [Collimonas humicola]|uniref:transposase n=1 Tax=Collimonas humicola TaxID=2825886 RepID=UPI001B8AA2D9|nr:transposase [Collimonas humicola]
MFIRDDQWSQLNPLLLGNKFSGGTIAKDNRLFVEAILWHVNNQRRWTDLPIEYGSWSTCYVRFRRWNESGVWKDLVIAMSDFPELAREFQKIADYGALYDALAIARLKRKENRKRRVDQILSPTKTKKNTVD